MSSWASKGERRSSLYIYISLSRSRQWSMRQAPCGTLRNNADEAPCESHAAAEDGRGAGQTRGDERDGTGATRNAGCCVTQHEMAQKATGLLGPMSMFGWCTAFRSATNPRRSSRPFPVRCILGSSPAPSHLSAIVPPTATTRP